MLVLLVELWVHDGQEAAFEALERELAQHIARHGGRIDQAIRLDRASSDAPFEVHVVRFPDRAAFDAYRADPAVIALAPRRESAIARTVIRSGHSVRY